LKSGIGIEKIPAILLAAGEGRRFGGNKQLAKLGKRHLIEYALRAITDVQAIDSFTVLGARAAEILPNIEEYGSRVIINALWPGGIGTSIKFGLRTVLEEFPDAPAIMICVADQPYLNAEFVERLLNARRQNPTRIIASKYEEQVGTPAIFPCQYFDEILAIGDGEGAKSLIQEYRSEVVLLEQPQLALDIDTQSDLEKWVESSLISRPAIGRMGYAFQVE
jgi:molybdenum cofactor cytidylyltransferase